MLGSMLHYDQRITRSRLGSCLAAWSAVHDRVSLYEYLRYLYRRYQGRGRRSRYPLPFEVLVEQGKISPISNPDYDPYWQQLLVDPAGEDVSESFLIRSEVQELGRELQQLEEEEAQLTARRDAESEGYEELAAEEDEAINKDKVLGPTTRKRPPRRRGRPRLPFPWKPALGSMAIVGMVLFEAYQFAIPYLNATGVDVSNLAKEWTSNPIGVWTGGGFALAVSVAVFILWNLAIRSTASIPRRWGSEALGMTALRVVGTFILCLILLGITNGMADMRHDAADSANEFVVAQQGHAPGAGMGKSVFMFLTLVIPFAAAYLQHEISQSEIWMRRREINEKRGQWDREEEQRILAGERLADRMRRRQHKRDWIERRRDTLRNKRRALAERAQAAERRRLVRLENARWHTVAYANSLLAALERDRYYFIRAARKCKADRLVVDQPQGHAMACKEPPQEFVRALLSAGNHRPVPSSS